VFFSDEQSYLMMLLEMRLMFELFVFLFLVFFRGTLPTKKHPQKMKFPIALVQKDAFGSFVDSKRHRVMMRNL